MAQKISAWQARGWIRGEKAGDGNQGHTHFARRQEDPDNAFNFVLKKLKRQDDSARRRRFFIEAETLRAVSSISGIAKLIDSNADKFEEASEELFVVTERIYGTDLQQFARESVDVETACGILTLVLESIGQCHSIPVVHRDIKPCHVILRSNHISDPVLIDFGLAYNEEMSPTESLTELEQGVGNRFIILPEQLYGPEKRDPRSDVTQCVGLLYFLLTGRNPGIIAGRNRRKPHEDSPLDTSSLSDVQKKQLLRVFDIGFEWDIDRRWPTAESLTRQLAKVLSGEDMAAEFEFASSLDRLSQRVRDDPMHSSLARAKFLFERMIHRTQVGASEATQRFREQISVLGGQHLGDFKTSYSLSHMISPSLGAGHYILTQSIRRDDNHVLLNGTLTKSPPGAFFANAVPGENIVALPSFRAELFSPETEEGIDRFVDELWVQSLEKVLFPA
ncbi:MAG: serine/threonine protein kinase [Pirellulales bacterium]